MIELKIVKFCAEEVERQQAKPTAVWWMVNAWNYALGCWRNSQILGPNIVELLGKTVDPGKNGNGFRKIMVWVGEYVPPQPVDVPHLIEELFPVGYKELDPGSTYKRFQEIHPFVDGNGRTGKIIFNWLNGTLDDPQMPLNFWGIANP